MITLVEVLNYKCFRYLQQPLGPFHLLTGANGSGKTTFLDMIAFVSDFISEGLKSAIEKRTPQFENLVWMCKPGRIELAIEADVPKVEKERLPFQEYEKIRYELAIGNDLESKGIQIFHEALLFKKNLPFPIPERTVFPKLRGAPFTLITPRSRTQKAKRIFTKVLGGAETFYPEAEHNKTKPSEISGKPSPLKSALDHLPEDEKKFPVSSWFKNFMCKNVKRIMYNYPFNLHATRRKMKSELSQLAWIWNEVKSKYPGKFVEMMTLFQALLPDLKAVQCIQTEEGQFDLVLEYKNNLKLPLEATSTETFKIFLMILTFFHPNVREILYLIEEIENGLHPRILKNLFQFFASKDNAQILFTTYSPMALDQFDPAKILYFAKTPEGIADVIPLAQHPKLKNWKGNPPISTLFTDEAL